MSVLTETTIYSFKGSRRCAVSPYVSYKTEAESLNIFANGNARGSFLMRLHGILEDDLELGYSGGIVRVEDMEIKFVSHPDFWGGDGIVLSVPPAHSVQNLSKALDEIGNNHKWVVYDLVEKKYYSNGEEVPLDVQKPVLLDPAP